MKIEMVIKPKFETYYSYGFNDGVSIFKKNKKFGLINNKGDVVVESVYDYLSPNKNGVSIVSKNKKYGLIDKKGNIIIPIKYFRLYSSPENYLNKIYRIKPIRYSKSEV
ncbi:MAG: hypothetical protein COA88_02455 [Kordia sp.]|nr:MAG: hypothetical protein COA88_02455 [Kordia sp.]